MNRQDSRTLMILMILNAGFAIFGILVAGFAMYAAWEHNPQGEFHDETGVHWGDWLLTGCFCFIVTGVVPAVLASLVYLGASRSTSAAAQP